MWNQNFSNVPDPERSSKVSSTFTEIRLTLDTKTGVMNSTGITVKGLKFKMTEIEPLQLNCNAMPVTVTTDNDLKDSYIQYYSSCVRPINMSVTKNAEISQKSTFS